MSENKIKIVRIEWLDHNSVNGWQSAGSVEARGHRVESVGWLIKENDDVIVLAQSVGEAKAADYLCVLKSCIVDRWEL